MGAERLAAVLAVNQRLAVIDEAERLPRLVTGVRVRSAPEMTDEQRARVERLLVETGF